MSEKAKSVSHPPGMRSFNLLDNRGPHSLRIHLPPPHESRGAHLVRLICGHFAQLRIARFDSSTKPIHSPARAPTEATGAGPACSPTCGYALQLTGHVHPGQFKWSRRSAGNAASRPPRTSRRTGGSCRGAAGDEKGARWRSPGDGTSRARS